MPYDPTAIFKYNERLLDNVLWFDRFFTVSTVSMVSSRKDVSPTSRSGISHTEIIGWDIWEDNLING